MSQVSDDVMQLVELLTEEGYVILAGELLTEIGLGHDPDDFDDDPALNAKFERSPGRAESDINRVPFSPSEQMSFALEFLELRLVSPVRALAEAEAIAGKLAMPGDKAPTETEEYGRPIRLAFRPPGRPDFEIKRADAPGSTVWADQLSNALSELREEI